jgi:hypothetical protein
MKTVFYVWTRIIDEAAERGDNQITPPIVHQEIAGNSCGNNFPGFLIQDYGAPCGHILDHGVGEARSPPNFGIAQVS